MWNFTKLGNNESPPFCRSDGLKIGGTSWKKLYLWTRTKNMWIRNWSLITFGEYNSILMSRAASLNKKKRSCFSDWKKSCFSSQHLLSELYMGWVIHGANPNASSDPSQQRRSTGCSICISCWLHGAQWLLRIASKLCCLVWLAMLVCWPASCS